MHKVDENAALDLAIREWMAGEDRSADGFRLRMKAAITTYLTAAKPNAEAVAWVPEDELPESLSSEAYGALYPHSRVDGIRWFPIFAPRDTDVPRVYEDAVAEAERVGKWEIDHSTPSPILTYEKCSVIQDDQAYYALRLIQADQAEEAERDVVTDERRKIFEALLEMYKGWVRNPGNCDAALGVGNAIYFLFPEYRQEASNTAALGGSKS